MRSWEFAKLQSKLPSTVCVDVGASYYPHTSWWFFLDVPTVNWIAVEPNSQNMSYVANWAWNSKIEYISTGLSQFGGLQTLFVTNVDSGSSLLQPVIPKSMKHRLGEDGEKYFFPVHEIEVETLTLESLFNRFPNVPRIIKLDTQGSELAILKNVFEGKDSPHVIGIEIECSLLATPLYQNSPRLWEVAEYLEAYGFELLFLDVFPRSNVAKKISRNPREVVNECDAMFALRRDIVVELSLESRLTLFGFYITNSFYKEAIWLLEDDSDIKTWLVSQELSLQDLLKLLNKRL